MGPVPATRPFNRWARARRVLRTTVVRMARKGKMNLTRLVVAKRPRSSSILKCFIRSLRKASFKVGCLANSSHH